MTPPTWVLAEVPSTRMPSSRLATTAALLAALPRKLPWTTVLSELVMRSPLAPLPHTTL